MRRLALLLPAMLFTCLAAHAQAPIERRPPDAPVLDPDWQSFAQKWNYYQGAEVRVQAWGHPLHCHLDFISNDSLECIRDGRLSWFVSEGDIHYNIPRQDVREVHLSSRAASALIGIAAGFGVGAIVASSNPNLGGKGSAVLLTGLLGAPLFGSIGYQFPLRGRTIFRAHH